MAAGAERLFEPDSVMKIAQFLRDYFAPEAIVSVYQQVARFLHLERTTRTMDGYSARFDLLRYKPASRMRGGDSFLCELVNRAQLIIRSGASW